VLGSAAFPPNGALPSRFGCRGGGRSPPLSWSGVPSRGAELALVMLDLDAPSGTLAHWLVYGIEPAGRRFPIGSPPRGAVQGKNSFGRSGYTPPCPPKDDPPHRYLFALYALSRPSGLPSGAGPVEVLDAARRLGIASGRLTVRYAIR
jgi:Raf kinase inhibitor-like YbhB/YbcL family protein